jgi:hypothetical protein
MKTGPARDFLCTMKTGPRTRPIEYRDQRPEIDEPIVATTMYDRLSTYQSRALLRVLGGRRGGRR